MRIVILVHENSRGGLRQHAIGMLSEVWREEGHHVEVVCGTRRAVPADIAINHVDLTFVPDEYTDYLLRYPVAINARVNDISKRRTSTCILSENDRWDGEVIVKTNLNCRGALEKRLLGRVSDRDPWRFVPRSLSRRLRPRLSRRDSPFAGYRLFHTMSDVPARWWRNRDFVVEKFMPEREGSIFHLRKCLFLGERHVNWVFKSNHPIVKGDVAFDPQRVDAPDELLELRRRFKVDFGRMDYAIVDGRVILYDLNKAPSTPSRSERMLTATRELAPALSTFF